MCGIAGISMHHDDLKLQADQVATSLLRGIVNRGPDATGAAWYEPKTDTVGLTKVAVPAWRFIEARKDRLPSATPTMILHTRFATQGSAKNRANNHPIRYGNIVGVHNGVLTNDDGIFDRLGVERHGQVDSEAIFALLNQDGLHPTEVLGDIRGDAAIAWIDLRDPDSLHLARVTGRPLYLAQTREGSLLFASTAEAVHKAARESNLELTFEGEMEDEYYARVEHGVITDYEKIENVVSFGSVFTDSYAWTSGPAVLEPVNSMDDYFNSKTDAELEGMVKKGSSLAGEYLAERRQPAFSDELKPEWRRHYLEAETSDLERWAKNGNPHASRELEARALTVRPEG